MLDAVGTIESVDGDKDGEYDSSLNCFWLIIAPEDKVIKLNFTRVDIEFSSTCSYDKVQVLFIKVQSHDQIVFATDAL